MIVQVPGQKAEIVEKERREEEKFRALVVAYYACSTYGDA